MTAAAENSRFARVASLVEIFVVLALGNIAGAVLFDAVVAPAVEGAEPGSVAAGLYAGLRILLRIGFVVLFGLALLWYRRGLTPRDVGLTRAGMPVGRLVGIGIVLGAFSSFLVAVVFAVNAVVPLGDGLPAWSAFRQSAWTTGLWVELLATSIIIPPIVEEIMARGYMRLRLVECYGAVNGVILTGVVFALIHGKFLSTDPLLIVSLVAFVVSSIAWTYIAHATQSLIPSIVAHVMTNTVAMVVLVNAWVALAVTGSLLLWQRQPVAAAIRAFGRECRSSGDRRSLQLGIVVLVAIIAIAMLVMSGMGRIPALLALGLLGLAVTVANIALEKRSQDERHTQR